MHEYRLNGLESIASSTSLNRKNSTQVVAIRDIIPPPVRETFNDVYIAYELVDTDLHQIIHFNQALSEEHCQANLQAVNLSASNFYVPEHSSSSYLNFGAATSEVEIDLLTGATTIIRTDITYDCGQSLNPAVDLGQIEGAFVQGIGFFMQEEYLSNSDGLVVSDGTWTYKVPTVDTIPKNFNVEILNSGHHKKRVLSSKASGEPPLLLAASVHCATREAIKAARSEFSSEGSPSMFELQVPATMPVVKELCGLDNVERYLEAIL